MREDLMCPDESLLTAYVDNEVPSPWKERIEMHLGQCERCANRVAQYRALKLALKAADVFDAPQREEAAKRIQASLRSITDESSHSLRTEAIFERYPLFSALMSRRISVPLPVLAASLLITVFFAGLAFGIFGAHRTTGQALALSTRLPEESASNIESIVSLLSQTDPNQFVTIHAPGNISSQPLVDSTPVYVIYNPSGRKPTIMAFPVQGEIK